MSRIVHAHLNVRGALMNYRPRDFQGMIVDESGRTLTPREAKAALLDELAKGREALPVGDACEGFSYRTGCPGHDVPEGEAS